MLSFLIVTNRKSTSQIANIRLKIRVKWRQPASLTYAPLYFSVPWKGVARGKPGLRNSDGFPLASSHITALAPQILKKHAFLQVSLTTPSQSDVSPLFSKRARWEECRGGRRARDSEPPSFAKVSALSQSPDS